MTVPHTVAGRYAVVRPIGRGAAATVYVATTPDGREVALKLVPTRAGLRPDEVDAFRAELLRSAAIEHPGIVGFEDAGLDNDLRSIYLVMPLLHGETFREILRQGRASFDERLDVVEAALIPLAHAHARGQIHADLTPSNVFRVHERDGTTSVRLLDLGLTSILAARQLVQPGLKLGSPGFMAPEQLGSGAQVGPAADVWAFGVVLYEAMAGARPFDHPSLEATVRHVCHVPHPPLLDAMPAADSAIAQLVDLCLDKEPGRRPPDALALLRLIKTLRTGIASFYRPSTDLGERMASDTVVDPAAQEPIAPSEDLDRALRRTPRDPEIHRALLAHYESVGSKDGAWLAACALVFLRAATKTETRLAHLHRARGEPPHDRGLDASGWAALLHPDQDPRIDAVWEEVVPALARIHRRDEAAEEQARAIKVDYSRPTDELARAYRLAVGMLRPGTLPNLYRSGGSHPPRYLSVGAPASLFARGFEEPLPEGALRFAIGRHVGYLRTAHRVCTMLHEPEALEAAWESAVRVGLGWPTETEEQAARVERLKATLDGTSQRSLRVACARLGTSADRVDLGTWRRAVELSCLRAGLFLSADLDGATWMLRWSRERRPLPMEDAVDELLRFVGSGAHVRARHSVGISVT
ncbi:MAG: protein kinase [Sandaracinaceae bacterium]